VLKLLEHFPALALLGPRQCGKTTLAFEIQANWPKSSRYLDLENISDLAKLDEIFLVSRSDDTWTTADGLIHTHLGALPELLAAHAGALSAI